MDINKVIDEIEEIVYPHYNGTAGLFKKSRWDLKFKNGDIYYIYNYDVVSLINLLIHMRKKNDS